MIKIASGFVVAALLAAALLSIIPLASATHSMYRSTTYPYYVPYSYSQPTSTYTTGAKYFESPGFTRAPSARAEQAREAGAAFSDFDSAATSYDYRGPTFERQIAYKDDFAKESSSRTRPFSSRSSDSLRHSISTTITEKYLGATESLTSSSQNRRSASQKETQKTSAETDDGFSFGKQRIFDASEYGRDSYTKPYYYRPIYDTKSGYYRWD